MKANTAETLLAAKRTGCLLQSGVVQHLKLKTKQDMKDAAALMYHSVPSDAGGNQCWE